MSKRRMVLAVVVAVIAGASLVWYFLLDLHITSSDPSGTTIATSQHIVKYTFSMPIKNNPTIRIKEQYKYTYLVTGSTISIQLLTPLADGSSLTIQIEVESATMKKTFTQSYKAQFVEFTKLSSDQQASQIKSSDSFETSYPLINKLPYRTNDFEIDYRYPSGGAKTQKLPLIITSLAIDDSLGDTPSQSYLDAIKSSRDAALSYLKSNGYDENKYSLYVTEPYLLADYNAKDVSSLDSY